MSCKEMETSAPRWGVNVFHKTQLMNFLVLVAVYSSLQTSP